MVYEYSDYRKFLKNVILEKQSKNPKFSLRLIARQLGMAPSSFSEVLSGKKNLSYDMALTIGTNLGLKSKEVDYFCLLVKRDSAKRLDLKKAIQKKLESLNPRGPVHNLDVDMFSLISDWFHLALLGVLVLDIEDKTLENLSALVGIERMQAEAALDRLIRLGLVELKENKYYSRTSSDIFVNAKISTESLHKYHRQMLEKAKESLEGQKFDERLVRTENIAIGEDQLEQADAYVEEFFTKMASLSSKTKKKTKLYHLGTHFFKLSREGKGKKS